MPVVVQFCLRTFENATYSYVEKFANVNLRYATSKRREGIIMISTYLAGE